MNKIPDIPKENIIIYDWLSLTTRKHSLYQLIEMLELNNIPWETVRGAHGFMWRQYFTEYQSISTKSNLIHDTLI